MSELPLVKSGNGSTRTGKKFWREKMDQNRERDHRTNRALRAAGWRVLRIWEHELEKANLERVLRKLKKGAVLASAEADQPRARVFQIKLAK